MKESEPMTYAYYHQVKRGITPRTSPIYIEESKDADVMPKYRCNVCGYIYEHEKGDSDGGIKPGTPFEELPDGWLCPICEAAKSEFESIG